MERVLFLLVIGHLALVTEVFSQTTFERTYGGAYGDVGRSVQQTSDGGFIIAGWTRSFGAGSADVYLIKTDASGDTLWTKTYGGTANDLGYSVQETSDGGFIIAGWTTSFGAGARDVYLIKTNAGGDTLWTKTYGGTDSDGGSSVQQTVPDGGFIIAGETYSFGADSGDVYLIKTDANGVVGVEEGNSQFTVHKSLFRLSQNHPNPFHSTTIIRYQIPSTNHETRITTHVILKIYDIAGRLAETLVDKRQEPGIYQVEWDGRTGILPVRSGIYFYRLTVRGLDESSPYKGRKSGDFTTTKKLILLR